MTLNVRQILEGIKANNQKLDSCSHHEFEIVQPKKPLGNKFQCARCLGIVDAQVVMWYERGQRHALGAHHG